MTIIKIMMKVTDNSMAWLLDNTDDGGDDDENDDKDYNGNDD